VSRVDNAHKNDEEEDCHECFFCVLWIVVRHKKIYLQHEYQSR
jgi:hypothetical protein